MGLSYDDVDSNASNSTENTFVSFEDPFEASMAVHALIMSIVYYTHLGVAKEASKRLAHLHALLDSDALKLFRTGTIKVS